MVKLSIPGWDKDKDRVYAAGDSFTPDFSGRPSRPRTAPPTPSTSLAPLFRLNPDASNRPEASPFITLKLSSPSFLDSVVHDDLSNNPLYAIETVDNITKIRRSDAKGFITTSRVRWTASSRPSSAMRRSREFDDPCISFGNGSWKPVDEFLTFSYGTLSMSRKFYAPHHPNSLRWKRVGAVYHCLTNDVKGPVAILEPAVSATLPQLKVFNPMLRSRDTSRPQKMHGGVPISLLDFLLATALLLVTEPNEWTNVTRPGPMDEADEDDEIRAGPSRFSRTSHGSSLSLSSLFNAQAPPEPQPLPPPVPNMPSVEQWRKTVPPLRATSPDALRSGSPSSPAQTSGGASHSSDSTDPLSTPASPGASHLFSLHSPSRQRFSSVPSLAGSSAPSRELPMPPLPVPRADQPWLHSYAGSSSSTPTPNPYFSPTHAASAPRSLPRTPVDLRKSMPSALASPPQGFALPKPQLPSKPPPNYMASAHHAPVPLGLGFVQNPDEGLEPAIAMQGLSIATGGADAGYDLPPPAYSAADAARSPWQNPAL